MSDISGAFDRVFKFHLLGKLLEAGIGDEYMRFLIAYLDKRSGHVAIDCKFSDRIELDNMVFQRTVLGPTLWNLFFADVAHSAVSQGGDAKLFADDLNVFKAFSRQFSNEEIQIDMMKIVNLMKWQQ